MIKVGDLVKVRLGGKFYTCIVQEVDTYGWLVLYFSDGTIRWVHAEHLDSLEMEQIK
tara:strand:- start:35 stop:205 length:171 start_codon:yes stop_codon:yes gene_type:complete